MGELSETELGKKSLVGDDTEVLGVLGGEYVVRIGYEIMGFGFRRLKGLNLPRRRRGDERKFFADCKLWSASHGRKGK